jgi:hypothetical protein
MKVIISENQSDKIKDKILNLIKKQGWDGASKILGISKLKIMKMIDYDINDTPLFGLFPLLVEEISKGDVGNSGEITGNYKECEIVIDWYDDDDYGVYWACPIKDEDKEPLTVVTFAFPNFNKGDVYVDNGHCYIDDTYNNMSDYNMSDYNVKTIKYDIPTHFNDYDELRDWFHNEYLPKTHKIILKQGEEILKQLKEKDLI